MNSTIGELFYKGVKNSGLYSDVFYKYQESQEEKIPIYSSGKKILGYLPRSILKEKSIYEGKKALIMYRKGKAGTLCIPYHDKWACSEDGIPLILKDEYHNKINLELIIKLVQHSIYERTTSKSDNANANWDMISNIKVDYNPPKGVENEYTKLKKFQINIRNTSKKSMDK